MYLDPSHVPSAARAAVLVLLMPWKVPVADSHRSCPMSKENDFGEWGRLGLFIEERFFFDDCDQRI